MANTVVMQIVAKRSPKRSYTVIQLEQPPSIQVTLDFEEQSQVLHPGVLIAIAIIATWFTSLVLFLAMDVSRWNFWMFLPAVLWQTFLYTGLFITAHDAMHGVAYPGNAKINHFIGTLSLACFGLLPYKTLLKKHWLHHHHPASELDPDFHDGTHKSFFAWYFHFMKNYWSWGQIIGVTSVYNFAKYVLHIPDVNLIVFWVVPSLLSSLQLFYFGTYLTHSQPPEGYHQPHNAKSTSFPVWLSFLTCYHFGYHEEHHEFPHLAWWQLPHAYKSK